MDYYWAQYIDNMYFIYLPFSFLLGLAVGSFLNCIIYRLLQKEAFWRRRSYCPNCGHKLRALDLIPLFGFIFLKGRCQYCQKKISWQYPLVELVTAVLFILVYLKNPIFYPEINLQTAVIQFIFLIRNWFFVSVLLFIFIFDLKYYLIPDKIILPAIIITLILNILLIYRDLLYSIDNFKILINFFIAVLIGGGFFLIQFLISRGRWVGGGDIRLGVLMGLILGYPTILLALFLSYLVGAIIGTGLVITGRKRWKSQVPLGPFLAGATIVVLLYQ